MWYLVGITTVIAIILYIYNQFNIVIAKGVKSTNTNSTFNEADKKHWIFARYVGENIIEDVLEVYLRKDRSIYMPIFHGFDSSVTFIPIHKSHPEMKRRICDSEGYYPINIGEYDIYLITYVVTIQKEIVLYRKEDDVYAYFVETGTNNTTNVYHVKVE